MLHPPSAVASSFSTRALSAAAAASAAVVVATATATATTWYPTTSTTGCQEQQQQQPEDDFRIEVHLMDKIQQKHYLQSASKDAAGIPSKLRILAVDLPELRTDAFSGVCRLSHDKIFLDEVAPPKVIAMAVQDKDEGHPNNSKEQKKKQQQQQQKLKVAQKTLVKVRGITFLLMVSRRYRSWSSVINSQLSSLSLTYSSSSSTCTCTCICM
jgi:hypothetical protein